MLTTSKIVAFVATQDRDRAKIFYRDILGLPLVNEDPFACVFDANGTMLRLISVKQLSVAPYTALGWEVEDIATSAREMRSAGVQFEIFPGLPQDTSGIWNAPGGTRVAWFKDPDGNILSISQHHDTKTN